MLCIIPASGFGTRMGMQIHESKEMLPDRVHGYKYIIDYALYFCKINNLEPLVITRKEKTTLIDYLKEKQVKYILYQPKLKEEWYKTVLASKDQWQEENLLLLPDTRFGPLFFPKDMENSLKLGNKAVFALHSVDNSSKWGIIKDNKLYEKPKKLEGKQWAWGLIAFKKNYGKFLFKYMKNIIKLKETGFIYLNSFEDITRGKK